MGNIFFANGALGTGNGVISGGLAGGSVDFGGQVTYNKSLTNPQGQLNLYIHSYNKPDGTQTVRCIPITSKVIPSPIWR